MLKTLIQLGLSINKIAEQILIDTLNILEEVEENLDK